MILQYAQNSWSCSITLKHALRSKLSLTSPSRYQTKSTASVTLQHQKNFITRIHFYSTSLNALLENMSIISNKLPNEPDRHQQDREAILSLPNVREEV